MMSIQRCVRTAQILQHDALCDGSEGVKSTPAFDAWDRLTDRQAV